jgi:hypothetical protein
VGAADDGAEVDVEQKPHVASHVLEYEHVGQSCVSQYPPDDAPEHPIPDKPIAAGSEASSSTHGVVGAAEGVEASLLPQNPHDLSHKPEYPHVGHSCELQYPVSAAVAHPMADNPITGGSEASSSAQTEQNPHVASHEPEYVHVGHRVESQYPAADAPEHPIADKPYIPGNTDSSSAHTPPIVVGAAEGAVV